MIPAAGAPGTAGLGFRAKGGAMAEQDDVRAWLDGAQSRRDRAWDEVAGLCDGSRRWTMRVPVDEDRDSDAVIAAALTDAAALTTVVRAVLDLADEHARCCGHVRAEELRAVVEGAVQR